MHRCKLRRRAPAALARGLRGARTLRTLNLAGCVGLGESGGAALAGGAASCKTLEVLSLAFVPLGGGAVEALVQVGVTGGGVCVCVLVCVCMCACRSTDDNHVV